MNAQGKIFLWGGTWQQCVGKTEWIRPKSPTSQQKPSGNVKNDDVWAETTATATERKRWIHKMLQGQRNWQNLATNFRIREKRSRLPACMTTLQPSAHLSGLPTGTESIPYREIEMLYSQAIGSNNSCLTSTQCPTIPFGHCLLGISTDPFRTPAPSLEYPPKVPALLLGLQIWVFPRPPPSPMFSNSLELVTKLRKALRLMRECGASWGQNTG